VERSSPILVRQGDLELLMGAEGYPFLSSCAQSDSQAGGLALRLINEAHDVLVDSEGLDRTTSKRASVMHLGRFSFDDEKEGV